MMMLDCLLQHHAARNRAHDFRADAGVSFHLRIFVIGQRSSLGNDLFGHEDLAYIVDTSGIGEFDEFVRRKGEGTANHLRVAAHHIAVAGGMKFTRFRSARQGLDGFLQNLDIAVFLAST